MAHAHSGDDPRAPSHAHGPVPPAPVKTRRILAAIIVPLALATLAGMALLWPTERPATVGGEQPPRLAGTATAVQPQPCTRPDAADRQCGTVTVRLADGQTVTARIPEGPGSPTASSWSTTPANTRWSTTVGVVS